MHKTAVSRAMSGSRAENTCCCSYCCRSTENGDLAWTAKALSKIYCHKRDADLSWSWICVLYHVLRRCTRGDNGVYLHRAGPGAMGHRRCLKGYDRAFKWYSEKQRGTVLGSETISLVSCHMTYKPPPRPISLSHRITYVPCRAAMAPWLLGYPRCPKRALQFFSVFSNKAPFGLLPIG